MHEHGNLVMISFIMDLILVAVSVWMAMLASKLNMGGAVGKTVGYVVTGAIILGLAHLIETLLGRFNVSGEINEVVHRGVILVGFTFLALGIRSLVRKIGPKR